MCGGGTANRCPSRWGVIGDWRGRSAGGQVMQAGDSAVHVCTPRDAPIMPCFAPLAPSTAFHCLVPPIPSPSTAPDP